MAKILKLKQTKIRRNNQLVERNQLMKRINDLLLNYFNWVILIIVLTILVVGFLIIIKPKYELVVRDVELVRRDKEGEYLIQQSYLNKLNDLQYIYQSIKSEDKRKIDIILPEKVEVEKFFSRMETMVLKKGLILTSLQIDSEELGSRDNKVASKSKNKEDNKKASGDDKAEAIDLSQEVGKIKITMNIIGTDYDGLKNLLHTIESNLRLMDIENISWSPDGNSTSLELVTYYMK